MKKLGTQFHGMPPLSAAPQAETKADSSEQGWIFDGRLHGKNGVGQEFLRPNADQVLLSIVENSDDAIVTKNLDGIVSSWNKAAERIFG
jgi:PAS domain-containing protein